MKEQLLDAVEGQPHARAVLAPAVLSGGSPSHAYLFFGPPGTGKRAAARAFATALLAAGAPDGGAVAERVARACHPDLTWVKPSGASELLVSDIEEPVVGAAARTPFESSRRVFVIEAAGSMNDQAANRLLKTLEEPASFVHLILLADHAQDVLPTIASRCQPVRFDPLPSERVRARLAQELGEQIEPQTADACARLAEGDMGLAKLLAGEEGVALRACAEGFVRAAMQGHSHERRWAQLLEMARQAGTRAAEGVGERLREQAGLLPERERRKHEREGGDAVRRADRRARAQTLDLGLRLAELWVRDVWCVRLGAPELVLASDRRAEIESDAQGRGADALGQAVERVGDTRLRLGLNVSEELALEALSYGIEELLG